MSSDYGGEVGTAFLSVHLHCNYNQHHNTVNPTFSQLSGYSFIGFVPYLYSCQSYSLFWVICDFVLYSAVYLLRMLSAKRLFHQT